MLFAVGTRVRLLHSQDEGVITALLDNGMANVMLEEGDFEIPVFLDDIARADAPLGKKPTVKAKFVPGKQDKTPKPPERPPIETQYAILKSFGIQIAFDPVVRPDGLASRYKIYLINDTGYDVLFTFELYIGGSVELRSNNKLARTSVLEVGEMLFDQLNDAPTVEMDCWQITTQGTGPRLHKTMRIKPKPFFKRLKTAPLLNKQVHLFRLFEKFEPLQQKPKEEDLRDYTRRNARRDEGQRILGRMPHEVMELAEFIPEIDLHIEHLTDRYEKMNNAEILNLQLHHFEQYLRKALRLGVERVFIIHGLGKGKLRDSIARRLREMPEVIDYRNEYHPRYGYGATEVIF
jgi:hypothetical protein